jgi:hypothetical protein
MAILNQKTETGSQKPEILTWNSAITRVGKGRYEVTICVETSHEVDLQAILTFIDNKLNSKE